MLAITFISATKKRFSGLELQSQLGLKRYEPVFRIYHKIRVVMGKRDDIYKLEVMVEDDEAFVGKAVNKKQRASLNEAEAAKNSLKLLLCLNQPYWRILTRANLTRVVDISS